MSAAGKKLNHSAADCVLPLRSTPLLGNDFTLERGIGKPGEVLHSAVHAYIGISRMERRTVHKGAVPLRPLELRFVGFRCLRGWGLAVVRVRAGTRRGAPALITRCPVAGGRPRVSASGRLADSSAARVGARDGRWSTDPLAQGWFRARGSLG